MPIPIAPNSLWEVRMNGFIDRQQTITTWHYLNDDAIPNLLQGINDLGIQFALDNWAARIRSALSVRFENVYFDVQCIRPVRYRAGRNLPANRAGTVGGDCTPSGVAVVIRRQTEASGRRFQGRIYLPGIPQSAVVESTLTVGYFNANDLNLRNCVLQPLVTAISGAFTPVIFHPGAVGPIDQVALAKTDIYVRYQRRREIGIGI